MKKILTLLALSLAACSTNTPPTPHTTQENTPDLMSLLKPAQSVQTEIPFFNTPHTLNLAQTGFLAHPDVQAFIQYHSQHSGLNQEKLQDFFQQVQYQAHIIRTMNKPGTSRPWYEFRPNNAGGTRISHGKQFYQKHQAAIDAAAQKYGVPASIIVAIIGIETNYGRTTGSIRVADSLATLSFDYPRRAAFFQKELLHFLQLAQQENRDPMSYQGSFAGAMGMPQFMPSSFLKWAVDGDGDGKRDIWNNVADAAASVANYMKIHGWQTHGKMIVPVQLQISPELQSIIDGKTELNQTVASLKKLGVQPLEAVDDQEAAILFRLETAPNQYEYFIGLNNFYVVWQYNHSRMYVTAVRDIANGVAAYPHL